jgi:hypothetical protein
MINKKLENQLREEKLQDIQKQKINILSLYFNQSDELISLFDRIPQSALNKRNIVKELARIDLNVTNFNKKIYPELISGMSALALTGYEHSNILFNSLGANVPNIVGNVGLTIAQLESPLQSDLDKLIKAGIYEPASFSKVDLELGLSAGGENRFNRMFEKISQIKDPQLQKELMQALVNYANSADPIGEAVRKMGELYGVFPTSDYKFSDLIWDTNKRDEIYKKIIDGINQGKTRDEIRKELEEYLKTPGNKGFYNIERVINSELQRAYSKAKLDSTREFNRYSDNALYIVQNTSPYHKGRDICDALKGTYNPRGRVPEIPRHPWCMCSETIVFKEDYNGKVKNLKGDIISPKGFENQKVRLI